MNTTPKLENDQENKIKKGKIKKEQEQELVIIGSNQKRDRHPTQRFNFPSPEKTKQSRSSNAPKTTGKELISPGKQKEANSKTKPIKVEATEKTTSLEAELKVLKNKLKTETTLKEIAIRTVEQLELTATTSVTLIQLINRHQ